MDNGLRRRCLRRTRRWFDRSTTVTLFDANHALVVVLGVVIVALLVIATVSLKRRIALRHTAPAAVTLCASVGVLLLSVLGWIPGLGTMGVIAVMVVMSARTVDLPSPNGLVTVAIATDGESSP